VMKWKLLQVRLKQSERTSLIENADFARSANAGGPFRYQLKPEGMEGSDPHLNSGIGIHRRQAFAHFLGGLVRKGQGEERARKRALVEKVLDPPHKGAGLSCARSGIDKERSLVPGHSGLLAVIQIVVDPWRVGFGRAKGWQKQGPNHLVHDQIRR
jgi:hypothetical protein